jgi:hypothetical protein
MMGWLARQDGYDPDAFDVPGEQSTNVPGALLNAGNWFLRQAVKPEAEAQADVRNVMGALAAPVMVPGQMMKPNPYPPGSEEAAFYDASKISKGLDWAPEMALNMMGGGVAGTGKGGGVAVGSGPIDPGLTRVHIRKASELPMDEASRMARAKEQGYTLDAYHGTRSPEEITEFQTGHIYSDDGDLLHAYSGHPNSLIGPHAAAEPAVANRFAMGEGVDWLKSRNTEGDPAVYPLKLNATKVHKFKREDDLDTLLFRQKSNARGVEEVIASKFDDIDEGFAKYDSDKAFREKINREAVRNENNYDEPSTEVGQSLADAVRDQYKKAGVTTIQYPNAVEGGTSYISIEPPRSRFAKFDPANKDSGFLLGSGATDKKMGAILAVTDNQPTGIKAYHSSPHDFDKFDLAKIGTGEGAQAYGHGLYFAESPAVSGQGGQYWQQFKNRFKGPEGLATQALDKYGLDRSEAADRLSKSIAGIEAEVKSGQFSNGQKMSEAYVLDQLGYLRQQRKALEMLQGPNPVGPRTYEVNINADPAHMLDWDKPLSAQPHIEDAAFMHLLGGMSRRKAAEEAEMLQRKSGDVLYRSFSKDPREASQILQEQGIPGIKYLDQGSRSQTMLNAARNSLPGKTGAERQQLLDYIKELETKPTTSNYVVFDPGIIDIMKKYGIAGVAPVGMGALAAQDRYE